MRVDARYHRKCQRAAYIARKRQRDKIAAIVGKEETADWAARGREHLDALTDQDQLARALVEGGFLELYNSGATSQAALCRQFEVTQSMMSRTIKALNEALVQSAKSQRWSRDPYVDWMLGGGLTRPDRSDTVAAWRWAFSMTRRFLRFEQTFFSLPGGKRFMRPRMHVLWIVELMFALVTGGYLQIMAPPRHGKSQLLTHLAVWLICQDRNIRIAWVGPNEEIAKDFVGSVMQQLESNSKLIQATLAPGLTYAPTKRGAGTSWSTKSFTVMGRQVGLVGATMVALGRGAKVLSKNVDVLVGDDMEDTESVSQPSLRKKTRKWFFNGFDSRVEEHTAVWVIGSRQDEDDLYGHNQNNRNFRHVVVSIHDPECELDPEVYSIHVRCMAFPQLRTYRWMMSKKDTADSLDVEDEEGGRFDLVYMNDPSRAGDRPFTEKVTKRALNHMRRLGLEQIPESGRRLVGGLDPGSTGIQALFIWAFTPYDQGIKELVDDDLRAIKYQDFAVKRWMVDLWAKSGGGIAEMLEQMKWANATYGVKHFVVENHAIQEEFTKDPRVLRWAKMNDVHIEPHSTQMNKWDPKYGLGSMAALFGDENGDTPVLVDLPYGDSEAKAKTEQYRKQLHSFTGEISVAERKRKKDLHMASWFPNKVARRYEKELVVAAEEGAGYDDGAYQPSFPSIHTLSGLNEAPWR